MVSRGSSCFPIGSVSAIRKKQWIWNELPLLCCVCAFFQMFTSKDLTRITIREVCRYERRHFRLLRDELHQQHLIFDEPLKRESHKESWERKEKVHVLQRRRSFCAKAAKMKSYPGVCFPFFFPSLLYFAERNPSWGVLPRRNIQKYSLVDSQLHIWEFRYQHTLPLLPPLTFLCCIPVAR